MSVDFARFVIVLRSGVSSSSLSPSLKFGTSEAPGSQCTLNAAVTVPIFPAAIGAAADVAGEGRLVSREALREKLREQGHAISSARASTLAKIVKARSVVANPNGDSVAGQKWYVARPTRTAAASPRAGDTRNRYIPTSLQSIPSIG